MPVVMVRNNQAGPTVMALDPKATDEVVWQGAGDPNGEDVMPVSEALQASVPFQKALRKGVLTVLDAEADAEVIADHDARQNEAWDRTQGSMGAVADKALEKVTDNDLVSVPCIGPSGKAGVLCGVDVVVRAKEKDKRPPLCSQHTSLASQYIQTYEVEGTQTVIRWSRVTMGERQRQQD